ncbi:uncharacterized protein BX664DRAFT_153053 [Halteromyces radiatus]|uniref:uncharacterized protein n=1 Tax=Halteromyces radiatus TaxID=101107 RepID=UPI00221E83CB|nr:uncharacterized protein BX664DRAFT_153053 [Halteromyces radiatus]KAI8086219.1 hypothetical protein BX664DRAFT_153053 [Halteromyces radiatus]
MCYTSGFFLFYIYTLPSSLSLSPPYFRFHAPPRKKEIQPLKRAELLYKSYLCHLFSFFFPFPFYNIFNIIVHLFFFFLSFLSFFYYFNIYSCLYIYLYELTDNYSYIYIISLSLKHNITFIPFFFTFLLFFF